MKKMLAVGVFVFLLTHFAVAGPFGLEMGMSIEALKSGAGMASAEPGTMQVINPPKPNPRFKYYYAWATEKVGLYSIGAVQPEIETSAYGDELRSAFSSLVSTLEKIYGKARIVDGLKAGSIWNEPRDWMTGLLKKERVLAAYWTRQYQSKLPADLDGVSVEAKAISGDTGGILLRYQSTKFEEAQKELSSAEAGSL
jgi:hypothetical protein